MKKQLSLSLNLIKGLWSGTGTKLTNAEFCLSVLPEDIGSVRQPSL